MEYPNKSKNMLLFLIGMAYPIAGLYAQLEDYHGDFKEMRRNIHSGNQIRMIFYNDGHWGRVHTGEFEGEWPINSGHLYISKIAVIVGSEVKDNEGLTRHIFSEPVGAGVNWPDGAAAGDSGPDGWYTFLPLPGFANPDSDAIAMSDAPKTWPCFWPDKMSAEDPGWAGAWNGYFGKDQYTADQESFYLCDDYNNKEFPFYPDSTNANRRGLGVRVTTRGLQWSNALVEDVLFTIYEVQNIGTSKHDKMVFGIFLGTWIGGDWLDDGGNFDLKEKMAFNWDQDNIGEGNWSPVGWMGAAFLESPGNATDGIDNDFDAQGDGPMITEEMFDPVQINQGDQVVVIDYTTYERNVTTMPATLTLPYRDKELTFTAGDLFQENPTNNIDDNLNGLIDENKGVTVGEPGAQITNYLYVGAKYVNYFTGEGLDDLMLDESRDDGIDNNSDWNPLTDDTGLDGKSNTGDIGEGDGQPTSGIGTGQPGERHIDLTDINESDMLGLTSFNLFTPWYLIPISDDEMIWQATIPGYLDNILKEGDTELIFASGYFPMQPKQRETFSLAFIFGDNRDDLVYNKKWAEKSYIENYQFARAPLIPTVIAVPGDNTVTLYWDNLAEQSCDPISGYDFEGYKIYRSTSPDWKELEMITDNRGSEIGRKPLAQFDLNNGISGDADVAVRGSQFYLGKDTGLVNSYIDTTAKNGYTYYYAVTAYDHGEPGAIAPSECSKIIALDPKGDIVLQGTNVVVVKPEARPAGFVESAIENFTAGSVNTTTGQVNYDIVDDRLLQDGSTYRITFTDTLFKKSTIGWTRSTTSFTLINLTSGDTLLDKSETFKPGSIVPMTEGFRLSFRGDSLLEYDEKNSGWNRPNIYSIKIAPFSYQNVYGLLQPHDYKLMIGDLGVDTCTYFTRGTREYPAKPVNFKIINIASKEPIEFGFIEQDGNDGVFSAYTETNRSDQIIFLEKNSADSLVPGFVFSCIPFSEQDSTARNPAAGDIFTIKTLRPFLSHDVFEFTTKAPYIDHTMAADQLDKIRVVPNPYIVTNSWEPKNLYLSGRGERRLHFIHLPQSCTIRIFNIRGILVREIEHFSDILDGTCVWDMLTKDRLDIAYGIYIYHIDAGELGEKIGKFAVIK